MFDELSQTEKIELTDHLAIAQNIWKAYGCKKKEHSFGVNLTFESPSTIAKIFAQDFKT